MTGRRCTTGVCNESVTSAAEAVAAPQLVLEPRPTQKLPWIVGGGGGREVVTPFEFNKLAVL